MNALRGWIRQRDDCWKLDDEEEWEEATDVTVKTLEKDTGVTKIEDGGALLELVVIFRPLTFFKKKSNRHTVRPEIGKCCTTFTSSIFLWNHFTKLLSIRTPRYAGFNRCITS